MSRIFDALVEAGEANGPSRLVKRRSLAVGARRRRLYPLGGGGTSVAPPPGPTFANDDSLSWIARLTGPVTNADKLLVDDLITVLKGIGLEKFDLVQLYCIGTTEADALLDILGNFDAVNSGAAYTAGAHLETNGTSSSIASGWNPSTAGGAYGQNGGHFGAYFVDQAAVSASGVGQFDGSDGMTIAPRQPTSNRVAFRVNQASLTSTAAGSNLDGRGLYIANRSLSNATQVYKNNAAIAASGNPNQNSTALNNAEVILGLVAGTFTAHQFSLFIAGGSLTAGEVADLYNDGLLPILTAKGLV